MAPTSRGSFVLAFAAVISSLTVIKLITVNRRLVRERNDAISRGVELHRGQFVPSFVGSGSCGDGVSIGNPAPLEKQVIVTFTTSCPYCLQMLQRWTQLDQFAASHHASFVGISLD